ncbi:MAG TPA: serine hydrolase domain-containing protein [Gaiellaceae bacterium]|jgi:CubicO group peptidase (beta-lactamase class C family)|nr:serine hydrolase domain-containing protein [Gaiellaceae bacterium]
MDFSSDDWSWLGDFLKRRGLPGMAVAVLDRDGRATFTAKGWADLRRRPIERDTLFELGSIGKTFTALVAVELLDLTAPVTDYLPWFEVRSAYDPILVEHLLTHSAGLIRGADVTADSRFDVWALRDTETGFAPGERFSYSNVGYRTLGYVLEAATGTPYPELLRKHVLGPMGLESTEPEIGVDVRSRLAVGYDRLHDDRTPSPDDPLFPAPWVETGTGDGCLASTADDLAAFGHALLAGPANELTSGLLVESGDGWSYGYGLEAKDNLVRHGGSMPGFASTLLCDRESGIAVATLMNGPDEHDATEEVARFALDVHRGASPAPPGDPEPWAPDSPAAPELEEHAALYGRYRSYNPWLPGFRIEQRESGLTAACSWGNDRPLTRIGEAAFRVGEETWSPERLHFDAFVDGKALRANFSGETYYRSDFR